MNKHCYRIIFSRTQGELRVVSELARSCSTQPGQSRSTGSARLWVTVRLSLFLIGLALFTEPVLANGIVADGQLAPAQRPEVINTQNGVPQVNINAPNQAGISHNQYQQFDVDKQGAILNNSAVMTSTQLAGYIQGNAKLDPNAAPAKVIINEVNSNNPSQLRGFLEVAGGKAQVVVANPSGIMCDGCGTINAGRMTLTTGKPQLNADGSVAGYQVERGVIQVQGGGLNGDPRHDTEYVDILARAVQVNAAVWAKEGVSVVAGRNQVGADGKTVTALAGSDGNAPELAIDMGQMGGMYSGHIRMVGTEAGVGVRNQGGHLQAEKTLVVSSEGKLTWQAGAAEPHTQAGGDITLTARDSVEHHGKLYSGSQLSVQSRQGEITQSGTLAAAGNVTLQAAQAIQSSGHLLAGSDANSTLIRPADLTLESQSDIRASGSLMSQKKVSVTGRNVDISQSRVAAEQAVLTAFAGDVALQQAQVDSQQFTVNSQSNVYSQQAQIRAGSWQITADNLFNQAGIWSQVGAGESRFALRGALDNTDGSIETQQLSLNTTTLNNLRGRLVALDGTAQHWRVSGLLSNQAGVLGTNSSLQLDLGTLDNQQGTLQSQSHLTVTTEQGADNRQGKLLSGGDLTLNSQGADNHQGKLLSGGDLTLNSQGAVNNSAGEIRGHHLQLAAQALNNAQGQVISLARLQLDTRQSLDNQRGLIEAGDTLDISTTGNWDNRNGTALGAKQAKVTAGSLDNASGKLQSGGELTLNTTGNVNNQAGILTAQQNLYWQGSPLSLFNNDGGKLLSGGALSLNGGQLNNRQQGLIQSQQALTLNLGGAWNNQGGKVASGGSSTLRALSLINAQGEIQALDSLDMQFTRTLDNRSGNIISQGSQHLQAENIDNTEGWIGSQGTLTTISQGFDNQLGEVVSQQDAELTATYWNNQYGTLQSAANLVLRTVQDITNQGGKISAQNRLWLQGLTDATLAGVLYNAGGQLLAGEQLWIRAQGIDNQQNGLLYSQKQLQLTLNDTLDNRLGKLQSGENMQVSALQLLNTQGIIDSQQQLNLQLSGILDNTRGTLRANQAQQISADRVLNAQGVISSLGSLQLTTSQFDNTAGTAISQGVGDYHFSTLENRQGKIHSGGALTLSGSSVDNQGGQLVSSQALTLNSENVDNRNQGIISSQGALTVHAQQVNNRDGGLLIGTTQTEVNARTLDNTAGRVQSAGTLTLSQLDSLDNRQGYLLANNALSISGGALSLFNQGGNIQSGGTLTVSTQWLDNQSGTLLSQQALQLSVQQDYTHRIGDTISSNSAVTFSVAGVLTNLADWLLPGDLTLYSAHLNNLASLVGNQLHLTTGALTNQGRIEADTLTINADSLDNQTTLMADNLVVNSRILDNHGRAALIAATENISLITGERLTNREGALIYSAGGLQLASDDLIENRASNIEADGDLTLSAKRFDNLREGLEIAREAESSEYNWHRYNYYWRSYDSGVNTDPASMAPTTQQLTFRDDAAAASNPYGTLLNIDAAAKRAEVQVKDNQGQLISLWVNYLALVPNADGSYAMTFYETRGFRQNTVPTPYHNTVWREHDWGSLEQWDPQLHIDIAAAPFVTDYNNFRERTVTGTLTSDKLISAGVGAYLLAGGNMTLQIGEQLLNDASTISSNGNLTIDGTANIINRGYSVNERRQEFMVDHYDRDTNHWYPTFNRDETTALMTIDGVISGYGNVTIGGAHLENTTVNQAQISAVEAALNAAAAERAEWERNPLAVNVNGSDWQAADTGLAGSSQPLTPSELALTDKQHLASVATTIPNNGLFRQQTEANSPFLVVTDPRFTSKSNFLSSDYLLQRVGYDPSQVHKRLGDGYYEQRVVREQLLMLTGRQSLKGDDAMAQYQALMNNGIKVAEDFHLVPGVALTPSQIAALQQDIVWLVSETVETAEGPQTVWVPKVYLANSTIRVTGDGAVIAGGNLQLSTGSLSNAGNLFADKAMSIDTSTFLHQGGDIRADTINVQADSISLSTNLQNALRQASMSARDLSLSGGDISLQGAKLSATENLSLSASNSINITTARSTTTADVSVISGAMGNRKREGMEEAGKRMAQVSGEWQQALGSSLTAGGNLNLKAGQDITLQGSQASAGGKTQVQAGGNVSLLADTTTNSTHLEANSRASTVSNSRQADTLHTSGLSGDNGVTILAGGNFVAEGAQVESTSGGIGLSAQQVTIKEARQQVSDSDSEQNKVRKAKSQRQSEITSDTGQGSLFSAKTGVTVIAEQGDILLQGSTLQSEKGTIGLKATGDISLNASQDEQHLVQHGSSSSKGFLSSKQSAYQREEHSSTANGSLLSGQEVILQSGKDINVQGSNIVASDDISLTAKNNITVDTAENQYQSSAASQSKKSGFSGTGGIGFSYGTQSLKMTDTENSISHTGSTIGSTQGNVTLNAGNNLTVKGSDLLAGKDISLTGKEVNILAVENQSSQSHTVEQKKSGLTLALSGTVGSALNTAVTSAKEATKETDGRLAALQGMKAALSGVQAAQGGVLASENAADQNAIGVSLSYGSQSSKSEQTAQQTQSQGSTLTAGNNLNIQATGSDINVQGSQLQAGKDITLNAARDVNLVSAENTSQLEGKNESKGGSVGVSIGAGQGGMGISVSASVNKGKGSENGNGTTHTETTLNAGNNLSITSGRDTTLTGAQVSGDKVIMDVGRNLTLTSEQDSDNYDAKQQNASAGASFTFGSMTGSASVNLSRDKMHSNYDAVQEQTGVYAGKGGFDITVGEHTQLNGAVISSTANADKNSLDTGTLGFGNIENKAEYEVEHQSVGISSGGPIGSQFAGNMANGLLTGVNGSGSASSTTQSAISDGTITIRDKDNQTQNVDDLSRDVENANPGLDPIFDKEKEQNRLREAQMIGEIGNQVSDIVRTQGQIDATKAANDKMKDIKPEDRTAAEKQWRLEHPGQEPKDDDINNQIYQTAYNKAFNESPYGTGGSLQRAVQAATAAVQGLAGGNMAQALTGAAAPYLAGVIKDATGDNQAANAMAHAVLGAITAYASGNNALAGAAGAATGELMAKLVMEQLYPGKKVSELTESEKQTISALGTLAAGLAGGLAGDSTSSAVAGAQTGKNALENNFLSSTEARALDKELSDCKASGGDCTPVIEKYIEISNKNSKEMREACTGGGVSCVTWEELIQGATNVANDAHSSQFRLDEKLKDPDAAALVNYLNGTDLKFLKDNITSGDRLLSVISDPTSWPVAVMGGKAIITNAATNGKEQLIAVGVSAGIGAGIQYGTTGEVKLADLIGSGVIGAITAGKAYNPTVTWNAAGGYYQAKIEGDDPFIAALLSKAGASAGYAVGNIIKVQADKVFNPVSKQYEWVPTGVWTITKPVPQSSIPSIFSNLGDSFSSGLLGDSLKGTTSGEKNESKQKE
ncbi:hemagglutinin repeat-containing protein [Serratia sp. DD3]|uniref:hemagglutinin repeat-containing protein n=1 Tax=Serratia sp. DD3 TaxID=1410619 RepID=UPI0003C51965|nr:hemagglutinin repeat-containing protein [Serratia sp. DD3]KEY57332.1 filamentous hemagglutinin [Serratia sp. DD3]